MALSPRDQSQRRQQRTRLRLKALSNGRARLSVFRSAKNIYAQVIDDLNGVTLAAASTRIRNMELALRRTCSAACCRLQRS